MARCKKLLEENEQLGKLVSSDNIAKLEGEIALQNRLLSNVKDAQKGERSCWSTDDDDLLLALDYEDILLDMDTNMDTMSSTLLHMRQQLVESHRAISQLNEENTRLRTLCPSTTTTNGTLHPDPSNLSTTPAIAASTKSGQKRSHPSSRTTPNLVPASKFKVTSTLYEVDETRTPPVSASTELMDVESLVLTSTNSITTNDHDHDNDNNYNNNNNTNQHLKRINPLDNGINVTPWRAAKRRDRTICSCWCWCCRCCWCCRRRRKRQCT